MKAQEIFNIVMEHLFTQNRQSIDEVGTCMYRMPYGDDMLMCGIGKLIPDDNYNPSFEGNSSDSLIEDELLPKKYNRHKDLLSDLQLLHDHARTLSDGTFDRKSLQGNSDLIAKKRRLQRYTGHIENETVE